MILIILLIQSIKSFSNDNVYIVYKVNNQIITNTDIEKEFRYLISLNNQLKNLDKSKVLEIIKDAVEIEKELKKLNYQNILI